MSWAILLVAFSAGFFGSPHCLGMCGGIVTAFGMSMQNVSKGKKNALILTYHFGRLLSYSLLGVLAGLLGTTIFAPLMNNSTGVNIPRIVLGAMLVLVGLSMLGLPFLTQLEKLGMKFWQALTPIRKKVFPINSLGKALMAGLLWGFLPCGLVYGALMMAVAGHDVATGAVMMFVFGLGTMPMLIATQKMVGILRQNIHKFKLRQINGVIMVLAGLAVMAFPIIMHHNHTGHGGHNMNMSHDMATHGEMHHDMTHMAAMPSSIPASATMPMNHDSMNHAEMNHNSINHEPSNHANIHHDMSKMDMPNTASTPHH